MDPQAVVDHLVDAGVGRGSTVALVVAPGRGLGLAWADRSLAIETAAPAAAVQAVEDAVAPRWAVWSAATAVALAADGVRLVKSWDAVAVHRLLFGGWRADPGRIWARLHGLPTSEIPSAGPVDLFNQGDDDLDPEQPVRADGHLKPDWIDGGWAASPERMARWAAVLLEVARLQDAAVDEVAARSDRPMARRTAFAESTAELLCAELMTDGLPMDRSAMESLVSAYVGPRPQSEREAADLRSQRDEVVLQHVPQGIRFDLRSPTQVKSMLRVVGVEVPDTRAWRLEGLRDVHPLVDALLTWRKAERVQTTFGYAWLDENLGGDGRFRGEWSGSDGAAGRMTASAGLHNMPADLRGGVVAEPGHVFIRADLGQIEPRVLASVSGDGSLAAATQADDLYAPVAVELGVDRATAKVAVLGAMYGQTTGEGARALVGLRRSYPVAMAYLDEADRAAQVGTDLRTYGGRLVRMGSAALGEPGQPGSMGEREARSRAAARGRYGRNAMVQGAAAELFKVWAVTVRARGRALDAHVVLCLHDELLVHVPTEHAADAAALVDDALQEAAARWAPDRTVRFLAETSTIRTWAEAKA
ncbi:DNA polymerase [Aquihabitans sp. McL0605]|uniref:DNA polymerase n=1 Tax=Aquihabitans sp. McL0605 TaxID=3415671 RepID=UPI003CF4E866